MSSPILTSWWTGMRNKILLFIIIALIAAYFYISKNTSDPVTEIDKPIASITNDVLTDNITEATDPEKGATQAKNQQQSPVVKQTESLTDFAYDSDPVVNNHLIFINNQLCYSQLGDGKKYSIYLQQVKLRMDKKQVQYFEQYKDHCEELNRQQPELSLTNKNHIISQMKKAKATSLWGRIIKKEVDVSSLSQGEVQNLLRSNNPNILQEAPQYLESYYQEIIHWDLESVLANHDYDYINYIQQNAHQLYLCDLGTECQANSTIMATLCIRNQAACGLDFNTYVSTILTQGQQADIQLAMNYLQSQYQ